MDCSVKPTKHKGLSLISTTDYFYPSVEDPFVQGKIGCANVLSDLYAMGIVDCDNMLMILAASRDMTKQQKDVVTTLMIAGFKETAEEAETKITGGQTVVNPWPIIGGVAMSVCSDEQFLMPENAEPGDLIVLTKPLGTQVASNVKQWMSTNPTNWQRVQHIITREDGETAFNTAATSMCRLNRTAARLMHKYGAHAATDVTGFGLLGHARNLARNQKRAVNFRIHTLPIIKNMKEVDSVVNYNLLKGLSAETSGGLLICLPSENALKFCAEIEEIDKFPAWIIATVEKSDKERTFNSADIIENPQIIPF